MLTENELKAQLVTRTMRSSLLKNIDVGTVNDIKDPLFFSKVLNMWLIYSGNEIFTVDPSYSYKDFINTAHTFWNYRYTTIKEKERIEKVVKNHMDRKQKLMAYKKKNRKPRKDI